MTSKGLDTPERYLHVFSRGSEDRKGSIGWAGWMAGWLARWLARWLAELAGWLAGWLAG